MTDLRYLSALAPIALAAVPGVSSLLLPGDGWNGGSGTGFASGVAAYTDPTRTVAKPAAHIVVPPGQRFTDTLLVIVATAANNLGTLIGGIDSVDFNYEGREGSVSEEQWHTYDDGNGVERGVFGYAVTLKKPPVTAGTAQLYVKINPGDPAMQSRVLGPFTTYPAATQHDYSYTIDTGQSVSATNLHTFRAALDQARTDGALNPLITFKETMSNVVMNTGLPPFTYNPAGGYITVTAEAPVTFARTALTTAASVDSDSQQRPRVSGLWLKGSNITLDFTYTDTLFVETGKEFVLDGINMTNSRGPNALHRGGPYFTEQRVGGKPYFLHCTVSNLESACIAASVVLGGTFTNMSRDIFTDALCVIGTTVNRQNDAAFNDDNDAFTIQYTGSEGTATIATTGGADAGTKVYTFKWGANSATFTCGKLASYYAGTAGDGYLFTDLVDFVNGAGAYVGVGLADSDAGWLATLNETTLNRRASSGSLAGLKGVAFGDTDCKTAPLAIVSCFDVHGDWWQQRENSISENVLICYNRGWDMEVQNWFPSSQSNSLDFVVFNNAWANSNSPSTYFNDNDVSSQTGRSNAAQVNSHLVFVHNTMPNQKLVFRDDGTPSTWDTRCLIACNSIADLNDSATNTINAVIEDNHIHGGETALNEATGTTSGGDETTLYPDFDNGVMTPAGDLLTNLTGRRVLRDFNGNLRAANDAKGAYRVAA